MKFRKPVSAFLAAAMLVSSASVVSYAAEDEAMKKALTVVKERIDVPEELSRFDYRVLTDYGQKVYAFTWDSPEEPRRLRVSVCGKVITEYGFDDYTASPEEKRYTFAALTKAEIIAKAREEIERLNPTVAANIAVGEEDIRISVYNNYATVPISRVKDGVKVAGQSGRIRIDKNTGALLSYDMSWIPGAGFRGAGEAISREEAIEGYRAEFPITKLYVSEYDWETGEYTPHLIYRRNEVGQIDAFTGKKATFSDSFDYYENDLDDVELDDGDDDAADSNPATGGVSFTDEEIRKMELEAALVKPEQALADMIASGIWSICANAEVTDSSTYYDRRTDAYLCRATVRAYEPEKVSVDGGEAVGEQPVRSVYYGTFTMNALTGEVISFSGTDTRTATRQLISEEHTKILMNQYFSRIAGEKAKEFVLGKPVYFYAEKDKQGNLTERSYLRSASVDSPRYAYGIPCDAESVSISLDQSGRVSSYSLTYRGIEYPKPEKILTESEAYAKYFEQIRYEPLYRVAYDRGKKRIETALVYNAGEKFYIDAFSGALTYPSGKEIPKKEEKRYTDLDRSGYREIAETLALYDVTLMDGEGRLNADMAVTRADFAELVRHIGVYGTPENGEKPLTRKYAAKILAGYAAIAELPGLFRSPFADVSEDDRYVGYIALAVAQGYMKGENGRFRPSAKMTRGDALKLVYDYLSR